MKTVKTVRILKLTALFWFLVSVNFPVFSYNWPVDDPVITSTFGGNKWETFNSGIEILGTEFDVRPSEKGEMLFYYDSDSGCSGLPSGLGSFVVIEHERKLRTLYGSIDLSADFDRMKTVESSLVLGKAGTSGKSDKPHLYFAVIDSEFDQFVNPLLLLNSIPDTRSPVIRDIRIRKGNEDFPVEGRAVIPAGRAELLADIFDPCMSEDFFCPMAPYKIHLFLNGEEMFYICFESLVIEKDGTYIQSNRNVSYDDFYTDGALSLGEISLVPGESRFEVLASDYSGNESSKTFRLTVVE